MSDKLPKANPYPFGEPIFSAPDRQVTTKDGKSEMVCRVVLPMPTIGLQIETGIWCRTAQNKDGDIEQQFSVSLPRGIRPTEGIGVAEHIEAMQWAVLNGYDAWLTKHGERAAAPRRPVLVRKKAAPGSVTVGPQTVQSAAIAAPTTK